MERKKLSSRIFLFFFLFFYFINVNALTLNSDKYILYNLNDDKVLLEEKSNEKAHVASLTKIMTTIVAIENIDDFNEKITITNDMIKDIEWDVAVVGFNVGEKVTYNDLLYGSLLSSGADAVNALALSVSDSYDDFVDLMNKKVKELGLKNTKFANVVGLYDEDNYSTAYDMAQILKYSLENEKFKSVFETKKYTTTTGRKLKSTVESYGERLNKDLSYIKGGKTGYINAAGYCLASTSEIDDVNYLLVTLNAYNDSTYHIKDAIKTYTYYSENYSYQYIVNKDTVITTLNTKYAKEDTLDIIANYESKSYLINNYDKSKLKYEYNGINELSYFTEPNTKLGDVKIYFEDELLDEFELLYTQTLEFSILKFIWIHKVPFIIGLIVLLLVSRIIYVQIKRKIRKRRRARK